MNASERLPRLPNLTLRTLITLVLLFGLAAVAAWVASVVIEVDGMASLVSLMGAAIVGFALSPIILDLTIRLFYQSRAKRLEELAEHLRDFIVRTCEAHRMRPPKIRVIDDSTPTAFTYGWSPSTARVVYSRGLVELLTPQELEAVIGHELGHAKSWDILVASIASAVPTFIRELGRRVEAALDRSEDDERESSKGARSVTWVLRVLAFAAELVELSLSRTRELHADRFGAKACGSAAAMARALVKVSYGLASKRPGAGQGVAATLRVQGDRTAQGMLLSSGGSKAQGDVVQYAMAWDLWNPWARLCELFSTHPTTARRIQALTPLSVLQGEEPAVRFELERTRSLWTGFLVDVLFAAAPTLAFAAGLWSLDRWGLGVLGWALVGVGVALGVKTWFRYRGRSFEELTVAELLTRLEASPVRGIPCTLRGTIIGRGEAGLVWSDDVTFRDDTGLILIDHRQPLAIWEFLRGLLRTHELFGGTTLVQGWFRRGPVPYVEMKRMDVDGTTRRSYIRWLPYGIALLCVVLGVLVEFELFEPLTSAVSL